MPKKRGVNKSEKIRAFIAANPAATPKVIIVGLKQTGLTVTNSLVNAIKYGSGSKSKKITRRGRGPASAGAISFDDLIGAKQIADRLGGVEKAQKALGMLERLQ